MSIIIKTWIFLAVSQSFAARQFRFRPYSTIWNTAKRSITFWMNFLP